MQNGTKVGEGLESETLSVHHSHTYFSALRLLPGYTGSQCQSKNTYFLGLLWRLDNVSESFWLSQLSKLSGYSGGGGETQLRNREISFHTT